ncbi:hypothetical protein BDV59DRAFT_183230 [Aspergillus ambiguus]|uniref:uncharacterized protein n=1 Tax=Aspergillus ambiguus TaxID=176160 RepID=UPI003CCCA1B9
MLVAIWGTACWVFTFCPGINELIKMCFRRWEVFPPGWGPMSATWADLDLNPLVVSLRNSLEISYWDHKDKQFLW